MSSSFEHHQRHAAVDVPATLGSRCVSSAAESHADRVRSGTDCGTGALDLDTFCSLDHLLISADGGGFSGLVDDALTVVGRIRRIAVSIQTYALAPVFLAHSDCICTLPRRFLMRFAHELDLTAPPLDLPPARIVALWHPRNQEDAGHAWLRDRLYQAAAAT